MMCGAGRNRQLAAEKNALTNRGDQLRKHPENAKEHN